MIKTGFLTMLITAGIIYFLQFLIIIAVKKDIKLIKFLPYIHVAISIMGIVVLLTQLQIMEIFFIIK